MTALELMFQDWVPPIHDRVCGHLLPSTFISAEQSPFPVHSPCPLNLCSLLYVLDKAIGMSSVG